MTQAIVNEGQNQSATGTCADQVGNTTSDTQTGINIDKTPPTVSVKTDANAYTVDQIVTITCTGTDARSSVASSTLTGAGTATTCQNTSAPAYTLPVRISTLTATATDRADNTASASTTITLNVTRGGVCVLTKQFIQTSARYRSLTVAQRTEIDRLAAYLCTQLGAIQLTPAQKALLIKA